jgi:hypothetical protein
MAGVSDESGIGSESELLHHSQDEEEPCVDVPLRRTPPPEIFCRQHTGQPTQDIGVSGYSFPP